MAANKRVSVIVKGTTESTSWEDWIARFTDPAYIVGDQNFFLVPPNDLYTPVKVLKGDYIEEIRQKNLVLPLALPRSHSDMNASTRFYSPIIFFLRKLTDTEDIAFNVQNITYGYLILVSCVIRKLVFFSEDSEIELYSEALYWLMKSLKLWSSLMINNERFVELIVNDPFSPDNIERTVCDHIFGSNILTEVRKRLQQIKVSVKRTLKHNNEVTPVQLWKMILAICSFPSLKLNTEKIQEFFEKHLDIPESLSFDDCFQLFCELSGSDCNKQMFLQIIFDQEPQQEIRQRPREISVPQGFFNGNVFSSRRFRAFEASFLSSINEDGSFIVVPKTKKWGWTAFKISAKDSPVRRFLIEPNVLEAEIAEGSGRIDFAQAEYRLVMSNEEAPDLCETNYSSTGVNTVNFLRRPVYEQKRNKRISFLEPLIVDLDKKKVTQRNFSFTFNTDFLVFGFKHTSFTFVPQ